MFIPSGVATTLRSSATRVRKSVDHADGRSTGNLKKERKKKEKDTQDFQLVMNL
jgi:hypothetical protein